MAVYRNPSLLCIENRCVNNEAAWSIPKGAPRWEIVDDKCRIKESADEVLSACREAGIKQSDRDNFRVQSAGKIAQVLEVDRSDETVKCAVDGVGEFWVALAAVRHAGLREIPDSRFALRFFCMHKDAHVFMHSPVCKAVSISGRPCADT